MNKIVKAFPFLVLISYIGFIFYNKSATLSDMGIILGLSTLYGLRIWLSHKENSLRKDPTNPDIERLQIDLMKANLEMENLRRHKEIKSLNNQVKAQEEFNGKDFRF